MSLEVIKNFELISSTTVRSINKINKEANLLLIDYEKGDETEIELRITCYIDSELDENDLTETDSDGYIVKWVRKINQTLKTIYPFRLPGRCNQFDVVVNFVGSSGLPGILKLGTVSNSYYYTSGY